MLKGAIKGKGIIPPEKIGADAGLFRLFLDELKKRDIIVNEEIIR
jgi:saccharopine dehydrogenase-like NADP-dependent oxidoreductase